MLLVHVSVYLAPSSVRYTETWEKHGTDMYRIKGVQLAGVIEEISNT
jgi:hypothetical protein